MRICVLQPSYARSSCDYQRYDRRASLSRCCPGHEFHHEFLEKATAFGQIKALQRRGFDIFVNLCEAIAIPTSPPSTSSTPSRT